MDGKPQKKKQPYPTGWGQQFQDTKYLHTQQSSCFWQIKSHTTSCQSEIEETNTPRKKISIFPQLIPGLLAGKDLLTQQLLYKGPQHWGIYKTIASGLLFQFKLENVHPHFQNKRRYNIDDAYCASPLCMQNFHRWPGDSVCHVPRWITWSDHWEEVPTDVEIPLQENNAREWAETHRLKWGQLRSSMWMNERASATAIVSTGLQWLNQNHFRFQLRIWNDSESGEKLQTGIPHLLSTAYDERNTGGVKGWEYFVFPFFLKVLFGDKIITSTRNPGQNPSWFGVSLVENRVIR